MIRHLLRWHAGRMIRQAHRAQARAERAIGRYLNHVSEPVALDDRWLRQGKDLG